MSSVDMPGKGLNLSCERERREAMLVIIPDCTGYVVWRLTPGSTQRVKVGTYRTPMLAAQRMARG